MGKVALVVSVLALAGAGWAVVSSRQEAAPQAGELVAIEGRLLAIERALAEIQARPAPAAPLSAPAAGPASPGLVTGGGAPSLGPRLEGQPRAPRSVEERVAELERLAGELKASAADGAVVRSPVGVPGPQLMPMPGFWPTVEAAAKALKLDGVQASRLERVVEDANRDLDALYAKPNDEGVLWKDVNVGLELDSLDQADIMAKFSDQLKKTSKFRSSKVPGTSETYAEAERRIRKDAKERARSLLDADQAKTWDRSHPDALFRGAGGDGFGAAVSVFSAPGEVELVSPGR